MRLSTDPNKKITFSPNTELDALHIACMRLSAEREHILYRRHSYVLQSHLGNGGDSLSITMSRVINLALVAVRLHHSRLVSRLNRHEYLLLNNDYFDEL